MSAKNVLWGVLAGAATGALAGILLAPAKGSRTRKKILKKSEDYSDAVMKKFNKLLEEITGKFDKVMEDVSQYTEEKMGKPNEAKKGTKNVKG